jgi:hypothetical protein
MAVLIGLFEVPMNLINSPKSLESLKTRFESRTVALTNWKTFGVAVGAIVMAVEIEVVYNYLN